MRKDIPLFPGERIDELERNGYGIIQKEKGFRFGMDAVLLSGFAAVGRGETAVDLCTGNGIIPILLEAKTEGETFYGVEIQTEIAEMAQRSVALNDLSEKVHILAGDLRELAETKENRLKTAEQSALSILKSGTFSVVTANPPYMKHAHGLQNPDDAKAIARHEVACTFQDVCKAASRLLRQDGRFYLVHRPQRLVELMETLSASRLAPKRLKFVHPSLEKEANMVLIEAVKDGKAYCRVEKPVIVWNSDGTYTAEIKDVYGY